LILAVSAALGYGPIVGQNLALLAGSSLLALSVYSDGESATTSTASSPRLSDARASPVDWLHFVLLAVPLAIARPRFSAIWLLPIVLWVCPRDGNGDWLQPLVPAAVAILVLGVCWRARMRVSAAQR
jgi:hypothetical protein